MICIAGKNDIAVNILQILVKKINIKDICVVCNKNETGVNGFQKSLRYFSKMLGVSEVCLEELYSIDKLVFLSLEFDRIVDIKKFKNASLYNIHFSLLPKYKGMYTAALPLLNGEIETGVTLHKIDNGIDTGDIIAQKSFSIIDKNCQSIYQSCISTGTELVEEYLDKIIQGDLISKKQDFNMSTYYSKKTIDYNNIEIDFNQTANSVDRQIRAFNFRQYQLPKVSGHSIAATKITFVRSTSKPGTVIFENCDGIMISTIDFNVFLIFDKFDYLMAECAKGNLDNVRKINYIETIINSQNSKGWTPIIVATYNNKKEIVEYLLSKNADITICNYNGTNLLMYAKDAFIKFNDNYLLKLFKKLGLSEFLKDYAGNDLNYYLEQNNMKIVDILK